MKPATRMAFAGLCGSLALVGCRGPSITNAPPAIDVELLKDGNAADTLETFQQLLDGGLSFGTDPVLISVQKTLTVTNLGSGLLSISQVSVPDGGPFTIVGAVPTSVGGTPGSSLTVQFDPPQEQTYTGTLEIASDDPDHRMLSISLVGTGSTEGLLKVLPSTADFGDVGQGQIATTSLTLYSVGTAPLEIWSIALGDGGDPAFAIVSSTNIPDSGLVLDAGDSIPDFYLSFSPTATTPANATGTLVIESSDPTHQPYVVPLLGEGILAPIPVIMAPKTAALGETVVLDGGGSYDQNVPQKLPLTYSWELQSLPLGSTAELLPNTTDMAVTLTPDVVGSYQINLMVTNDAGVESIAPGATATISALPTDDLYVEMIWNNVPVDMDLHFLIDGGVFGGQGDCNAYNPDAGFSCIPGSDHLVGPGPEWVAVAVPPAADYEVECKLYDAHDTTSDATIVTVRVYVYGVLAAQVCQQLDLSDNLWQAVTIAWPSGDVTPLGSSITCPETN